MGDDDVRLVGLTGGIGSGKSSVSRLLATLGASIIDADQITHAVEQRGQPVWTEIWQVFGWSVLLANGDLDRKRLGRIVFTDPEQRQRLNQLVHPVVRKEIVRQVDEQRQLSSPIVVVDAPLLIESGLYRMVDEVWVVHADSDQQMQRICARDGVNRETAERRIRAQMPLEDKVGYADRTIDNRGSRSQLKGVVQKLWRNVASDE